MIKIPASLKDLPVVLVVKKSVKIIQNTRYV